jgi:hypothetical protein
MLRAGCASRAVALQKRYDLECHPPGQLAATGEISRNTALFVAEHGLDAQTPLAGMSAAGMDWRKELRLQLAVDSA